MNAIKRIALLLGVVVLAGCGGGGKSGGGGTSVQAPQSAVLAKGDIGPAGGTVTVTDSASQYYRTSAQFDPGVVTTSTQMTIQKPQTSAALTEAPEGLLPIDLRLQGAFSGTVTVTLPYSETLLISNSINESEIVVFGEAPNGGFEEMQIISRDTALNTITFETDHFSVFFATSPVLYVARYMGLRTFDAFDTAATGFIDPAQPYTFSSFSTLEFPIKNGKQSIKIGKGSLANFRAGNGRNAVLLHGVLSSSLTWARDGGRDNPNDLYASLIAPQSPYDNVIAYDWPWAVDLETNGKVFAKNMQANTNPSGLYDLFVHSAGGLVAQSAIQNHGFSNIQNLVMLGTPNQGSSLSDIAAYFSFSEITALLNAKKGNGILDLISGGSSFLLNLHTSGLSARRGTKYFGIAAGADQWVPVGSVTGIALNDSKIISNQDHGQVHTNGKNNGAWIYSREWVTGKPNAAPITNAGQDQTVTVNTQVTLTGSATDADLDTITYAWTQTVGPNVTLANNTTATATFTPTQTGDYTFQLAVNDTVATGTDAVTITVVPGNGTPVANAGADRTVTIGVLVSLDGSGSSDPDNDPLTYRWIQIAGTSVVLSNAKTVAPTLVPSSVDTYTFSLIVNDGNVDSAIDTVTITVNPPPINRATFYPVVDTYTGDQAYNSANPNRATLPSFLIGDDGAGQNFWGRVSFDPVSTIVPPNVTITKATFTLHEKTVWKNDTVSIEVGGGFWVYPQTGGSAAIDVTSEFQKLLTSPFAGLPLFSFLISTSNTQHAYLEYHSSESGAATTPSFTIEWQ